MTVAGTTRPGGRTARTRSAVLQSVRRELLDHGYGDLCIERIAEHAGVHKTTIYRRWRDRTGLVSDLLQTLASQVVVVRDRGHFERDLAAFTSSLVPILSGESGRTVRAILAAAAQDACFGDQVREFYAARYAAVQPLVAGAVERGDLPAGTETAEVILAAAAPLYYRLTVQGEEPTREDAARAARSAWVAARAGCFVAPPR